MPAMTTLTTTDDLRDPTSDLYAAYIADLSADGYAVFTYEANAEAFAQTYSAETGVTLKVARNRDGRYVASA